jgi:hypothetical protein
MSVASIDYADPNPTLGVPSGAAHRQRLSTYVRPAPPLEPPYDPYEEPGRPQLRVVTPAAEPLPFEQPAHRQSTLGEDFWGPQPTGRRSLPDPRPLARQYLQAALETLAGRRSPAQLQQWSSPSLFADLLKSPRQPISGRAAAPAVTSLHVSEPADGIAEVAAVIRRGDRFHAVAARLEGVDGRWRFVHLQIG